MRHSILTIFAALLLGHQAEAEPPIISSFSPDGTLVWANMSTDCIAVVERFSPVAGGEWITVYAEVPTSIATSAELTTGDEPVWFRLVNADNSAVPSGMVLIPSGTNRGANPLAGHEWHTDCYYPATYSLSLDSFYMDRYEVTKALWDEVKDWDGGNGYAYYNVGEGKAPDHPVHTVNWFDCVKWCNARSEKHGRRPVYYLDAGFTQVYKTGHVDPFVDETADGYRLPTSEEWEYAARGGFEGKRFPWGDTISHGQANYYAISSPAYDLSGEGFHPSYETGALPYTSPVGTFEAGKNGFGLHDMAGNVWEWCNDWYPCDVTDRVIHGGSWYGLADLCRVGYRSEWKPGRHYAYSDGGFRTVLPMDQ